MIYPKAVVAALWATTLDDHRCNPVAFNQEVEFYFHWQAPFSGEHTQGAHRADFKVMLAGDDGVSDRRNFLVFDLERQLLGKSKLLYGE
jgi:hypothetical protein